MREKEISSRTCGMTTHFPEIIWLQIQCYRSKYCQKHTYEAASVFVLFRYPANLKIRWSRLTERHPTLGEDAEIGACGPITQCTVATQYIYIRAD